MENGFIKLWRKSINSRVFQNEGLWKVWTWCLLKANHQKNWVSISVGRGKTEVQVGPGQFIFGREKAAKELKMKTSNVRNRIEKLKNIGNLDIQTDSHYSIITIRNWGSYNENGNEDGQEDGQAKDRQRTSNGLAKDTNKNVKNVKNTYISKNEIENPEPKKKINKKFIPPKIDEVKSYFIENGYSKDLGVKAFNYYQAGGWKDSRGNQVKNWKQKMIANWFDEKNKNGQKDNYNHPPIADMEEIKRNAGIFD